MGRTHQIRVHLAEEHSPVLGDAVYGGAAANRRFAGLARRPLLHAYRLAFAHPRTGQLVEFEAPMPDDMQRLAQRMIPFEEDAQLFEQLMRLPTREPAEPA